MHIVDVLAGVLSLLRVAMWGLQGYAYILTHPGTPCIFYDHLWTDGMLKPSLWRRLRALLHMQAHKEGGTNAGATSVLRPLRSAILDLLKLRLRAGLHCDSQVTARFYNRPC